MTKHSHIDPSCEMNGVEEHVTFDFADAKDLFFKPYTPADNYLCLGDDPETVLIPMLGHNINHVDWGDWKQWGYDKAQFATCTAHCARCNRDLKVENIHWTEETPEKGVYTRKVSATFQNIADHQHKDTVGEATYTDIVSKRLAPYAYVKVVPGKTNKIQIAVAFGGNLNPDDYIVHIGGVGTEGTDGYNCSTKRVDAPFRKATVKLNKYIGEEPCVIAEFDMKASQMTMAYDLEVRRIANDAVVNECSIEDISIRKYALRILEDANNEYSQDVKSYIRAFLAYGAAAQNFDGTNTSSMANAPYYVANDPCHRVDIVGTGDGAKDWENADINQFKEARLDANGINGQLDNLTAKEGMNETPARYAGMKLTYASKPYISLVFKPGEHATMDEAIQYLKDHLTFVRNDDQSKLLEGDDYMITHMGSGKNAMIFFDFNGEDIMDYMSAGSLTNPDVGINMVIGTANSTVSYPVSFRSYVGSVASNNNNAGLINLCKALVAYDKYAKVLENDAATTTAAKSTNNQMVIY